MNDEEWLTTWERIMLIEEAKEQEQYDNFYASIPKLIVRHKTLESHLPLIFVTSKIERSDIHEDY